MNKCENASRHLLYFFQIFIVSINGKSWNHFLKHVDLIWIDGTSEYTKFMYSPISLLFILKTLMAFVCVRKSTFWITEVFANICNFFEHIHASCFPLSYFLLSSHCTLCIKHIYKFGFLFFLFAMENIWISFHSATNSLKS